MRTVTVLLDLNATANRESEEREGTVKESEGAEVLRWKRRSAERSR